MTLVRPSLTNIDLGVAEGWRDLGGCWITANVFGDALLDQVRVAHLTPGGKDCPGSGGTLAHHKLIKRDPLTITASLACRHCPWHGFITAGKWVPA